MRAGRILFIIILLLVAFGISFGQSSTGGPRFSMTDTLSDEAQRTTLAFDGLAMITGNLEAQSFFPPGKVADYTGFQYLRDNDPDDMGHNTSFLTRVANNVIYILNDAQLAKLKTVALAQQRQVDLYGYRRFALMKAFRRALDGDTPTGSSGLNLEAVKQASRELYLLDGQISFDRAFLYGDIYRSMDATQLAYLDAMKGKGWKSWPDITDQQIADKMRSLPQGTAVAVMTYASDLFSWYAGSIEADVYFCPERHGTYYGGFYIKDAPAVGHEGYSISEQLTATAGSALSDSSKGYVNATQAALMSTLVDKQRNNLYAGSVNIVQLRTQIATLLRGLIKSAAGGSDVNAQVLALSATYGELDGENNYYYATTFAQLYATLTADQKIKLQALRKSIMSGTYSDGTPFDFSICTTPFLYSDVITNQTLLSPYTGNTTYLFTVVPQTGWWWSPKLNGTGFFIEPGGASGSGFFAAGFVYDANGNPTWLVTTGPISGATYTGKWISVTGGQTLFGPYSSPTSTSAGNVTIAFSDSTHAVMTRPDGTQISLERFSYTLSPIPFPSSPTPQSGWWWAGSALSGTGYGIEIQSSNVFIVAYVFDASGKPVWYLATGSMATAMSFTGTWDSYAGGPQFTSPEGKYSARRVGAAAQMSLVFSDSTHAVLTMGNVVLPISRFQGF